MELFERSVRVVERVFEARHPVRIVSSFGKDSSVLTTIVLEAARRALANGFDPYVVLTHADVGVENPEMRSFADREIVKLRSYFQKTGISGDVRVARPSQGSGWAARIISGRALPSYPGSNSDCTTDWKILPMRRLLAQISVELRERFEVEVVTVIGTRYAESVTRSLRMRARNESSESPFRSRTGELMLSVIADWEDGDIYEVIGEVVRGNIRTYSDFHDLCLLYRDAGSRHLSGIQPGNVVGKPTVANGCGARFGCWACTRVQNDRSLEAMIEQNPERYGYMLGLNRLREYLVAVRWDFGRRMWIGRSIVTGYLAVRPDSFSPAFCLELLRLCLTLDVRECEAAARLGISPRFRIVTLEDLVTIDAVWSLQGYQKPFQAIREWHEIVDQGKRYDIPPFKVSPPLPVPEPRYFYTSSDWDEGDSVVSGLRDVVHEMVVDPDFRGGCLGTTTLEGRSKDETLYFFSPSPSVSDLPVGAVLGVPTMTDSVCFQEAHPYLSVRVLAGQSAALIGAVQRGEIDGVLIPGKKLTKAQQAMASSVGETRIVCQDDLFILGVQCGSEFTVDSEGAALALTFELDRMLAMNAEASPSTGLTAGYRWWLQLGVITPAANQLRKIDSMLRRTAFKERHGLAGASYSLDDVLSRSISAREYRDRLLQGDAGKPASLLAA